MAIEGFSPSPSPSPSPPPPPPYYQLLERGSARLGRVKNGICFSLYPLVAPGMGEILIL